MSDETFESRDTTPEIKENTEQKENPALEDSTLNPDTRVEQTQNFNTAEAIETALTATINNTLAETTSASTSSDDGSELMTEAETGPAASRGEVSATPINTPDPRENISETSTVTMDRVSDEPDHGPCPFTDEVVQDSQGASSPGEGISATPINLPYPVEGQAETGPAVPGGEVSATPINLPYPVEGRAETGPAASRGEVSATPINLPHPVEGQAETGPAASRGEVSATPINLPYPVEGQAETGSAVPGGEVSATPINLPYPVEGQAETGPAASRGEVSATPINLPYPVEGQAETGPAVPGGEVSATPINTPEPRETIAVSGDSIFGQAGKVAEDDWEAPVVMPVEPGSRDSTALSGDQQVEGSRQAGIASLDDWEAPNGMPVEPGSEAVETIPTETASETGSEGTGGEQLPPSEGLPVEGSTEEESGEEAEETPADSPGEADETNEAPKYYLHEDSEGKITVVDENGKAVDSPPQIVYFKGKYYAVYPGEDLPVKADGTIKDPQKLAQYEISSYKSSPEGMHIYTGKDGSAVVVDENGKAIDSPPEIVQDPTTGKYYFVTETDPSKMETLAKSGDFVGALNKGLICEAPDYKPTIEGNHIYTGKDGSPVVVDENGKPVDSPPEIVQDPTTGKYYFVTETDPSKFSSLTKSGDFVGALKKGLICEAPDYKPTTEGMHVYEDKDGSPVVVNENGKPVDSPPEIVQDPTTGKYYFVTETNPSKLNSLAKSGDFAGALKKGLICEAPDYKPPWWKK